MPTFPDPAPAAPDAPPAPAAAQPGPEQPTPPDPAEATPPIEIHDDTAARAAAAAQQPATWESLKGKRRKIAEVFVPSEDEEGRPIRLKITMQSISGPAWDALIDANQPRPADIAKGMSWHPDTFPAALIEACTTSPKLSYAQWQELKDDPEWSTGEFGQLFNTAINLCQGGFSVGFTGIG